MKKAPRMLSASERAAIIQKIRSLPAPPVLGTPFSLTPAKPIIPDVAVFDFANIQNVSGGSLDGSSYPAYVLFCNFANCNTNSTPSYGMVWLRFHTQQGKHYAIDCRMSGPNVVAYAIKMEPGQSTEGTIQLSANQHIVLATDTVSQTGLTTLQLTMHGENNNFQGQMDFWGCDVSPF